MRDYKSNTEPFNTFCLGLTWIFGGVVFCFFFGLFLSLLGLVFLGFFSGLWNLIRGIYTLDFVFRFFLSFFSGSSGICCGMKSMPGKSVPLANGRFWRRVYFFLSGFSGIWYSGGSRPGNPPIVKCLFGSSPRNAPISI